MAPLPEKYESLDECFDRLVTFIRTWWLNNPSSPFVNISHIIESDGKEENVFRGITYRHLAQLKHILPHAIEIRRVNVHNKLTSSMKPELCVSINVDAVKNDGSLYNESWNEHLRRVLRLWLEDFSRSHPEGDEIPEEQLPEPFNHKELDVYLNMKPPTSSFPTKTTLKDLQLKISETCIRDDEIAEGTEQGLNSNINNSPNVSFTPETSIEAQRKQQPAEAGASQLPPLFKKHFSKTDLQSSVLPGPESPLNKSSSQEKSSSAAGTPSPSKPEHKRQKHK